MNQPENNKCRNDSDPMQVGRAKYLEPDRSVRADKCCANWPIKRSLQNKLWSLLGYSKYDKHYPSPFHLLIPRRIWRWARRLYVWAFKSPRMKKLQRKGEKWNEQNWMNVTSVEIKFIQLYTIYDCIELSTFIRKVAEGCRGETSVGRKGYRQKFSTDGTFEIYYWFFLNCNI